MADLSRVSCAYCTKRAHSTEHEGDAIVPVCKDHADRMIETRIIVVDNTHEYGFRLMLAFGLRMGNPMDWGTDRELARTTIRPGESL